LNPNLVRLHDFSDIGISPWSSSSVPGTRKIFSGFYLIGGISRLNLTFALNWRNQLFEKNIYNLEQTQGLIYNITAMLPQPLITHSARFDALLVELAVESLQKCSSSKPIKAAIADAIMTLTAGYHYRRLNDFLSGQASDYYLFFSELRQIGWYLSGRADILSDFSQKEILGKYQEMPLSAVLAGESDAWGNIFYNSSGRVMQRANALFPQEPAQLFGLGWFSGEAISEYKIKAAYLAFKNDYPPCLLGQFVFDFVDSVGKSLYAQNDIKDYYSTYFVLDIMNNSHLKNTIKKLLQKGYLRYK
jgi:hypothetical protein